MNTIIDKPRAKKSAVPTTATAVPRPFWHQPTVEAHSALSRLLRAATSLNATDDRANSNEAVRLLDIACYVVDGRVWLDESLDLFDRQSNVNENAYDTGSLIKGALHFPDQPLSLECRTLLAHALAIIQALTDVNMSGSDGAMLVPKLLKTIDIPPQFPAAIRVPDHGPQSGTRDPLHGRTPKQAAIVFERIASMCDTARSLVYEDAQGTQGNHYAIGIMLESIGALADEMVDGEIIGTAADWSVGPSFRKAGMAVQA